MLKKSVRVLLITIMLMGIFFSIENFFLEETKAEMEETQLHEVFLGEPGDYSNWAWWCKGPGRGCYDVTVPNG